MFQKIKDWLWWYVWKRQRLNRKEYYMKYDLPTPPHWTWFYERDENRAKQFNRYT